MNQIVDRWRWFWHKPDIITAASERQRGSGRRPLNELERSQAHALARRSHQAQRRMGRAGRTAARQWYMAQDRTARNELRDWHRKTRAGRS